MIFQESKADQPCATWTVILGAVAEGRNLCVLFENETENETLQLSTVLAPGGHRWLEEMGILPTLTIAMPVF